MNETIWAIAECCSNNVAVKSAPASQPDRQRDVLALCGPTRVGRGDPPLREDVDGHIQVDRGVDAERHVRGVLRPENTTNKSGDGATRTVKNGTNDGAEDPHASKTPCGAPT